MEKSDWVLKFFTMTCIRFLIAIQLICRLPKINCILLINYIIILKYFTLYLKSVSTQAQEHFWKTKGYF